MTSVSSSRFLTVSLLAVFAAVCFLFAPYLSVFVLAMVFGVLFQPINQSLRKTFGISGASFITVVLVVLILILLLTVVVGQVVLQAGSVLKGLQSGSIVPDTVTTLVQSKISAWFPTAHIDILASFKAVLSWLVQQAGSIFQSIATVVLNLFLSIIALYYWFRDSEKFRSHVLSILPLSKEDAGGIIDRLSLSIHSLIKGTLVIALFQGISAGIGFVIFGVPNALLWASVTVVCALVPTLGTTIIFVPIVAYMALSGHTVAAVGVALWGVTAVGLLDNILGPKLMSRGSNLHPFFTLMAILGGIQLFGAVGVLAGPILVSLFFAICKTYSSKEEKTA